MSRREHFERQLSARERQIMDIVWRHGEATVALVLDELPDPPSYSAVRAMLRILEEKGHLQHREDGRRYVYLPRAPRRNAERSALRRVLATFFDDSPSAAVAALLDMEAGRLSADELDELEDLVQRARARGNGA
ncbi:MAG TPA: BlaI/MecI/CopY family transcriptional regulator [Thermoanaerobaculia bacterium]|nr:BlaI/MecI/CopY family transcriptional regulator [Thermoanaerobaculia bacterium]